MKLTAVFYMTVEVDDTTFGTLERRAQEEALLRTIGKRILKMKGDGPLLYVQRRQAGGAVSRSEAPEAPQRPTTPPHPATAGRVGRLGPVPIGMLTEELARFVVDRRRL